MLEKTLVAKIRKRLEENGCGHIKTHGAGYTRKGEPDIMGCFPDGTMFAIEVKIPPNKPTKIQEERITYWKARGAVAFWTDDYEGTFVQLRAWGYNLK